MSANHRIIDCFTFFNEFDLLEIRLEYLYDSVDYFVIVESDTAFNGSRKSFNFQDKRGRFQKYEEKIIYVPHEMPVFKSSKSVAWKREAQQRNAITDGLRQIALNDDDVVLMGDVDEIPKIELLNSLKDNQQDRIKVKSLVSMGIELMGCLMRLIPDMLKGRREEALRIRQLMMAIKAISTIPVLFRMDNFYYFLNNREKERNIWKGTLWIPIESLRGFTFNDLRELRRFPLRKIDEAGWHFSYLGGKEFIKHKIRSFSHQEYNIAEIVNDEYIDFCMKNGFSLFTYYRDKSILPQFELIGVEEFPESLRKLLIKRPNLIHT